MSVKLNRREVFCMGGLAAAAGVLRGEIASAGGAVDVGPKIYTDIGVKPFINLTATYTINGGTLILPEVKQAMEEASNYSVNIDELMERAGGRLAELLGCEAAIVSSGAAAAISHATAGCIAGTDPELVQQLPDLTGLKNEVIIPRESRNIYDHAVRVVGVKMVETGSPAEFHAALGPETAMIYLLGVAESESSLRLEEIAEAAQKKGVPIFVDAAAEFPSNPNSYLSRGADLVAYSGGKALRGPQCAGLLLGRKDLIRAAWINSSPHHAFGRMMKVGKEEIMGMLAAVEVFAGRGLQEEFHKWNSWLQEIADAVAPLGVRHEMHPPAGVSPYPTMTLEWDPEKITLTAGELYNLLIDGEPRIMSHAVGDGQSFRIRPAAMKPGHSTLVAKRLHEVFSRAPRGPRQVSTKPPAANVAGIWDVDVEFEVGASQHTLYLEGNQNQIQGIHQGRRVRGDLKGTIEGRQIHLRSQLPYESARLGYVFTGTISGNQMSGELDCGEYGKGRWRARRHAAQI